MQISFPISKYSKVRRQGVEFQTLGHTNIFTKVLCDQKCISGNVEVLTSCLWHLPLECAILGVTDTVVVHLVK